MQYYHQNTIQNAHLIVHFILHDLLLLLLLFLHVLWSIDLLTLSLLLLFRQGRTNLLWRLEFLLPRHLLFRLFLPLLLLPPFLGRPFHGLLAQEIFSTFDLQVDFTLLLRGRKRCVWFFALVRYLQGLLSLAQGSLLKMGQEAFPVLIFELGVLHQFSLDLYI